jgi:hypothetical protein
MEGGIWGNAEGKGGFGREPKGEKVGCPESGRGKRGEPQVIARPYREKDQDGKPGSRRSGAVTFTAGDLLVSVPEAKFLYRL